MWLFVFLNVLRWNEEEERLLCGAPGRWWVRKHVCEITVKSEAWIDKLYTIQMLYCSSEFESIFFWIVFLSVDLCVCVSLQLLTDRMRIVERWQTRTRESSQMTRSSASPLSSLIRPGLFCAVSVVALLKNGSKRFCLDVKDLLSQI